MAYNILSCENLVKSFDERPLLKGISFGLSQGDKVALVGHNGAGKSTLLKIITGELAPESGEVSRRKDIRVGVLTQDPQWAAGLSISQILFASESPQAKAVARYEAAMAHPEAHPELAEILEAMDQHNAWEYESQVRQVLGKLDIHDLDQTSETLSGGQKKRVALAELLLAQPDLIILDEPTNHLDLEAIEWLEQFLSASMMTVFMVSHDRYFLDAVCQQIYELDQGSLYIHKGKYAKYLENRQTRLTVQQVEVDKARVMMTRELDWIRRQPKARGTKARYRIDAFEDLKEKASTDLRRDSLQVNLATSRMGTKVMEISHLHKAYGDKTLLTDFSYVFKRGDRIGVVGRNGVGKSTFLNLLMGQESPDKGLIDRGETLRIGYYTQTTENLNPANRVIDEIKAIAEVVTLADGSTVSVSKLLDQFLFPPKRQYALIGKLSGGERRRLQLLKVLVTQPNFLILDEPTNDLDIDTLNVLEEYLEAFPGVLIIVSHDRYFMDRLVDHLFVFAGKGQVSDFPGNYSDYREQADIELEESTAPAPKAKSTPAPTPVEKASAAPASKSRLSFKEQKEYSELEAQIARLEARKAELIEALNSGSADHTQLLAWGQELEALGTELDSKELRWLELGERV